MNSVSVDSGWVCAKCWDVCLRRGRGGGAERKFMGQMLILGALTMHGLYCQQEGGLLW